MHISIYMCVCGDINMALHFTWPFLPRHLSNSKDAKSTNRRARAWKIEDIQDEWTPWLVDTD